MQGVVAGLRNLQVVQGNVEQYMEEMKNKVQAKKCEEGA